MKRNRTALFLVCLLLLAGTLGCTPKEKPEETEPQDVKSPAALSSTWETFKTAGLKVKSNIVVTLPEVAMPLTFEAYVDTNGFGEGLLGCNQAVYKVTIKNDTVYAQITDESLVEIAGLSARMLPKNLDIAGDSDLESAGFRELDGKITAYISTEGATSYDNRYLASEVSYPEADPVPTDTLTLEELVGKVLWRPVAPPEAPKPEKASRYVGGTFGVYINGVKYACGDYCNPSNYFEGMTPEGITPKYASKEDEKIELSYVSYLAEDGRATFMNVNGTVDSIFTNRPFKFLGIRSGISSEELGALLGVGLSSEEELTYRPLLKGMTVEDESSKYILTYGDTVAELRLNEADCLASIFIEKQLGFKEYDANEA